MNNSSCIQIPTYKGYTKYLGSSYCTIGIDGNEEELVLKDFILRPSINRLIDLIAKTLVESKLETPHHIRLKLEIMAVELNSE